MKKLLAIVVAAALLTGCASGPVQLGENEYMMTDQTGVGWSGGAVVADLIKQATQFCTKDGRQFKLVDSSYQDAQGYPVVRYASGMIQFRCETRTE